MDHDGNSLHLPSISGHLRTLAWHARVIEDRRRLAHWCPTQGPAGSFRYILSLL